MHKHGRRCCVYSNVDTKVILEVTGRQRNTLTGPAFNSDDVNCQSDYQAPSPAHKLEVRFLNERDEKYENDRE